MTFLFNIVVKACNYNFKHLVDHKNISSFMAQSLNQQLFDDHDEWNVRAQVALLKRPKFNRAASFVGYSSKLQV